jgi:hypothetical protein
MAQSWMGVYVVPDFDPDEIVREVEDEPGCTVREKRPNSRPSRRASVPIGFEREFMLLPLNPGEDIRQVVRTPVAFPHRVSGHQHRTGSSCRST